MQRTTVEQQVAMAVSNRWDDFAIRHPRLADVIDEPRMVAKIAERLEADPRYVEAIGRADVATAAGDAASRLVDRTVRIWLRELVRRV